MKKKVGWILIIFQVLAIFSTIASGTFIERYTIHSFGDIAELFGYHIFLIIGIILLLRSDKRE